MNKHDELIERAKNHCSAKGTFPLIDELAAAIKELVAENERLHEHGAQMLRMNGEVARSRETEFQNNKRLRKERDALRKEVERLQSELDKLAELHRGANLQRIENFKEAIRQRDQAQALAADIERATIERCGKLVIDNQDCDAWEIAEAVRALPSTQNSKETPDFLSIVDLIGELGREVFYMLDDCEESGSIGDTVFTLTKDGFEKVSAILNRIDELPYEEPGVILGTGAKLQAAIKQSLPTTDQSALDRIVDERTKELRKVTDEMVERACAVYCVGWSLWHEPQKKTARDVMGQALTAALSRTNGKDQNND